MIKYLTAILLLMLLTIAPASAEIVSYTFTEPIDGSAVVYYEWEVQLAGGEWVPLPGTHTDNALLLDQTPNVAYRLRVRGVDANGHVGGWSGASVSYNYTAPGGCGVPWRN